MTRLANIFASLREIKNVWFSRILIILLLSFLFFVTGGGISHNAKWRVTEIQISGAQVVSRDEVRSFVEEKLAGNYYFVYSRGNSYLFSRHDIEAGLIEKFVRLASATVNIVDSNTIEVVLTERKPLALWCGEVYSRETYDLNDCWFIDKTGFIFDRAPIFSEGVYPEVYGELENINDGNLLGARLSPVRFNFVQTVEKELTEKLGDPLRTIIKSEEEYIVTIHTSKNYPQLAGVELRFKDGTDADTLIKTLMSALPVQFPEGAVASKGLTRHDSAESKKLLYIDLRFGNKVFFGFEN